MLPETHDAAATESKCLSKCTILCWASFTAIQDCPRHTVGTPGISLLNHCVAIVAGCYLTSLTLQKNAPKTLLHALGAGRERAEALCGLGSNLALSRF